MHYVAPRAPRAEHNPLRVQPISHAPRFVEVDGDHMEPTLRRGDVIAVLPIDGYQAGNVLDSVGTAVVYRCRSDCRGGIDILRDDKAYATHTLTPEEFTRCVLGKAFATCKVTDRLIMADAGISGLTDLVGHGQAGA